MGVGEDVVIEGIAMEGEEDLVMPVAIEGRRGVEDDGDESSKVLGDHQIMRVEAGPGTVSRRRVMRTKRLCQRR